jgi:hypothetical protein
MNILIKNKSELSKVISIVNTELESNNISAKHQKLKECIAHSLNYSKFASLLVALPLELNTKIFSNSFIKESNKTFSDKIKTIEYFTRDLSRSILTSFIYSYDDCITLMRTMPEPEIFVDRGWGDTDLSISIINDGDGQVPYGFISNETYELLIKNKALSVNILNTYKARKLHVFTLDASLKGNKAFNDGLKSSDNPYSRDNDSLRHSCWHNSYNESYIKDSSKFNRITNVMDK